MKSIGIVRRVDEHGRVALPKEIRNVLEIKEGTYLDISVTNDNKILIEKYEISKEQQIQNALEDALEFLEEMPSPPIVIVEELQKALEIE